MNDRFNNKIAIKIQKNIFIRYAFLVLLSFILSGLGEKVRVTVVLLSVDRVRCS